MSVAFLAGGLSLAVVTMWSHFEVDAWGIRRARATLVDARSATSAVVANPAIPVDIGKELMITDLSVVEDPLRTRWRQPQPVAVSHTRNRNLATATALPVSHPSEGAWTFGKLMTNMAGPHDPADFVMSWLQLWEQDQMVNGNRVDARPAIRPLVIDPWLAASGGHKLDLKKAPFRLLAIVNRLDLRQNSGYAAGTAGEGRFVFGVITQSGTPLPFTVIFEYELVASSLADVKSWAADWHDLGSSSFGSSFNSALEAITDRFAGPNVAPHKPNGSAINQIRTNEIALAGPWELREFVIDSRGGHLIQTTTKQTPDQNMNNGQELSDWLNANASLVLSGRHLIPPAWLAGGNPENFVWNANVRNPEVRHAFAVNTCNGCHTNETGTAFTHVKTRAAGNEAALSGFLTGTTATDPVNPSLSHHFADLDRRADDLRRVLQSRLVELAAEQPSQVVH